MKGMEKQVMAHFKLSDNCQTQSKKGKNYAVILCQTGQQSKQH